ncbi:MAG: hypothetical protein M3O30_04155 [Planctomycetota bacterium]|nr:hypothetical protein [Planctomycetota bacterium]
MAFKQEVNIPLVLTIGVVSAIVLIVAIVGTQAWYDNDVAAEFAAKSDQYPNTALNDLKGGQKANISAYRWIDEKNQVVAIPIEAAMQVIVDTHEKVPSTQPAAR